MTLFNVQEALSGALRKQQNEQRFNRFLDNRISNPPNKKSLQTVNNEDGSITTKELCYVPYTFVQSETVLYPDGSRIYTSFYPSSEGIPAKRIEMSAKSTITKTTTFDRNGKEKTLERVFKNPDGSGVEEKIDYKFERRNVRKFNKNNVSQHIESYVKGRLASRIECDDEGNLLKETRYNAFAAGSILQKEIVYNNIENSYVTKEYNMMGQISSTHKTISKKTKIIA